MISYRSFKRKIDARKYVDKSMYDNLVKENGEELIKSLFERYLNDPKVIDDENKFNRVNYYLSLCENDFFDYKFDYTSVVPENFDIVRLYLNEISSIPLFTYEEEVSYFNRISVIRKKMKISNVRLMHINKMLEYFGYEFASNGDNTLKSLEDKMFYVKNLVSNLNNNNCFSVSEMNDLNNLIGDMALYHEYKLLVEEVAKANLKLVVSMSKNYLNCGVEFLDLVQEGNFGLKKAIEKYDVNKGFRFSTYAVWWIRQAMSRAIAEKSRTIRVSVNFNELISKVRIVRDLLTHKYYRTPTDDEILEEFYMLSKKQLLELGNENPSLEEIKRHSGINKKKLEQLKMIERSNISLYSNVGEDKDYELIDLIVDPNQDVEEIVFKNLDKEYICDILDCLIEKEKLIILLRLGFNLNEYMSFEEFERILGGKFSKEDLCNLYIKFSNEPSICTLNDIGELLKITRERVRQLEKRGFEKLENRAKRELTLSKCKKF